MNHDNIEVVKLATLVPDPVNARKHTKRNVEEVMRSLEELGQHAPMVVQRSTNKVIVGNCRLEAMKKLGWEEATVWFTDDDDIAAVRRALADNRTGELAEWDEENLRELIISNDLQDVPGWTAEELQELVIEDSNEAHPSEPGKSYLIHYDIIFDNEEQQNVFFLFLRLLKTKYQEQETLGGRLAAFIQREVPDCGTV